MTGFTIPSPTDVARTGRLSRRNLLLGAAGLGGSALLSGCVGSSGSTGGSSTQATSTTLTLQSSLSDPKPKAALEALMKTFTGPQTTLNTVAIEQFRAQLPTYLSSGNPPDVLTWYAGSVARDYASKGLLMDVSDMWTGDGACAKFSPALKSLSSAADGKQIFVPTNYYWWSVFFLKSSFTEWGVTAPTTWDEFMTLCDTLKGKGVNPLTMGTGSTPWIASGWFDYLDLRINGADFHRELLAGKYSFDSAEVRKVMDTYATLLPYFDPKGKSYSWQEAVTPMVQKQGRHVSDRRVHHPVVPAGPGRRRRLLLASRRSTRPCPAPRRRPTDGYFASAGSKNPAGTKELLAFLAGSAQPAAVHRGQRVVQPADVARRRHLGLLAAGAEGHQAARGHPGDHPVLQPRLQRRAADHGRRRADQVPRRARGRGLDPARTGRRRPTKVFSS